MKLVNNDKDQVRVEDEEEKSATKTWHGRPCSLTSSPFCTATMISLLLTN